MYREMLAEILPSLFNALADPSSHATALLINKTNEALLLAAKVSFPIINLTEPKTPHKPPLYKHVRFFSARISCIT